jgi:hypothetical protein
MDSNITINFPSGNIATPISHPLTRSISGNPVTKASSLDQVKPANDKILNQAEQKIKTPILK